MFLLRRAFASTTLIALVALGGACSDDQERPTTTAAESGAAKTTKSTKTTTSRVPMTIGSTVDPNGQNAWCDAVKVFNLQQRAALLLEKGQRDDYLTVARANLEVLKAKAPQETRAQLDPYFAAWTAFFDRVARDERTGAPIPIYDRSLLPQREAWKAEVAKCQG